MAASRGRSGVFAEERSSLEEFSFACSLDLRRFRAGVRSAKRGIAVRDVLGRNRLGMEASEAEATHDPEF